MQQFEPAKFLVVDDDEVSVMAIERAMAALKIINPLHVAVDGIHALEMLRGSAGVDPVAPPYIILLDLNMPRMSGLEFLDEVRSDTALQRAVIFVLTTSEAPRDVTAAYEKNIAGYIVKEAPIESFSQALSVLKDYAQLVVLPK